MAIKGVDFKWYDRFFLSMLATKLLWQSIGRDTIHAHTRCTYGLWDLGWQQRYKRFYGRIVVLSILVLLLYPFLLAWTVIGTLWFTRSKDCLPEDGQKWGFLIWLLFRYCGLGCIACLCPGKWLARRQVHQLRAQQGIPVSEYGRNVTFRS
ncbi:hypothetical protein OROHE_024609 [Orobanche hederae]